ncbi:hypothetical protein EYZ11_010210 [Aspergillus tanneri]|uniref:Lipoxygenase domain-containing protein n=1 Tax=Aspergillus tanneri TaxID=1220188 RepID=A0A4S3JBB3_9EURO|nr:hypothetical protein EYZ11_010210 [Aspergillus tanneri]
MTRRGDMVDPLTNNVPYVAIIVASNRQLQPDHLVMQLLYPHWQKTLALNAAARNNLVPHVIC